MSNNVTYTSHTACKLQSLDKDILIGRLDIGIGKDLWYKVER